MRRIAILVLVVSFIQFVFAWAAAVFCLQHVPVFNRGEHVAARMVPHAEANNSSLIADMQTVQDEIDILNFRRNLAMALTFFCDTLLYSIALCVFSGAVVLCRRAISNALSRLRPGSKNATNIQKVADVVDSLEQHQERMLGLSVCSIFALLLLIVCYIIMMLGMLFIKGQKQCPERYEAGPCSRYANAALAPQPMRPIFTICTHAWSQLPKRHHLRYRAPHPLVNCLSPTVLLSSHPA